MPKSKRDKKISLTKTSKKGLALKQQIVEDVRNCVEKYSRIFLISVQNMRNNKLKDVRAEWKDSRFFFGKNKIMALALGRSTEDEAADGLHKLSEALKGQHCLLFTNRTKKEVLSWLENYEQPDYARAGFVASQTVALAEGPMPEFPHSIEPHLRQLGMPTSLQKGVVTLVKNHVVCKEGQPLTPEQARILKLLNMPMASFKLLPIGVYSKNNGYKHLLSASKDEAETMDVDEREQTDNT